MKLIIDIPNEAYDILTEYQVLPENIDLEYFVIHGIPLEDIKTGLKEIRDRVSHYKAECYGLDVALEYIDNWIKGE